MKRFFQVECGRCGSYSQTLTERDTLFRMEKPITVCGQCGQNDQLKVEEIKPTVPCSHQIINLIGNEETGLKSCHCEICGIEMTRRQVGHEYEYYSIEEEAVQWWAQTLNTLLAGKLFVLSELRQGQIRIEVGHFDKITASGREILLHSREHGIYTNNHPSQMFLNSEARCIVVDNISEMVSNRTFTIINKATKETHYQEYVDDGEAKLWVDADNRQYEHGGAA